MERGSYVYEPRNPRDGQQTVGRSGGLGQLLTWSPRKEPAQPTPALGLPAPGTETAPLSVLAPRSGPRRYVTPGKQMPCVTLTWPREGCSLRLLPAGVKTQSCECKVGSGRRHPWTPRRRKCKSPWEESAFNFCPQKSPEGKFQETRAHWPQSADPTSKRDASQGRRDPRAAESGPRKGPVK